MELNPVHWSSAIAAAIAIFSLIGSAITFVVARRERAARIAGELAQAELAKKQAKHAEGSAAQQISEAAASAVATIQRVKDEVEKELAETRDSMEEQEIRMLTLQGHINSLMTESQICIEECLKLTRRNAELVEENVALVTEKSQLLQRVEELVLENKRLQKQVNELEERLSRVMEYVGLTGEEEPIE